MNLPLLFRRARAAASLAITWSLSWGVAASVLGTIPIAIIYRSQGMPLSFFGFMGAFGLAGAITGALCGVGFAVLITSTGRRRTLQELSPMRLGAFSGLVAGGIALALFGFDIGPVLATAIFGLGAGAATIKMARRADTPALTAKNASDVRDSQLHHAIGANKNARRLKV